MHEALPWIILILEVVGLFLLASEVYRGHQVEKLTADVASPRRLLYLYTRQDYDGFMIEWRLDQGDSPAQAQACIDASGTAAIKTAVEQRWTDLGPALSAMLSNLDRSRDPAIRRGRRMYLFTGAVFLIAAAFLRFVE